MEIKVLCGCGQKFKFDVEPVNGQMPHAVSCPACGADGTAAANATLAQALATSPQSSDATAPAGRPKLRLKLPTPTAPTPVAPPVAQQPATITKAPASAAAFVSQPEAKGEFNLGLGILGAFLGACIGVGIMYAFYKFAGFRFPLLGCGIGALTGLGAKLLYKGTTNTLGIISGVIALVSVVGTLYLMYGGFPFINIISVVVSVSIAYRIASG